MEVFRVAVLIAATMTLGISSGLFQLYTFAIMPGLRKTDDRTFVGAFQQIDTAIIGPWLFINFFGALGLTGLAAALRLGPDDNSTLPWIGAAFFLYLVVFVMTLVINVPLNDKIKAAGDPDRIADLGSVRKDFHETRWAISNLVRSVASAVAFGFLVWALVLQGRP